MILTKIYINNEQIDLTDDVSIPLNFNIADIREPEKRSTTWSKTVVLPGTAFNNKLFANIWNVNSVINSSGTVNFNPNFNPNLKAIAEITYNDATQFKGICQLLNVNVTDKYEIQYEVAFFGETQNVYQFFTNAYLRDLDLSQYNHAYNVNNIQGSWYGTIGNGYVYPMIDYGYRINSEFKVNEMFPAIYVKTIIDRMFLEAGYSYQSNFFNTDLFKRLIIPYSGGSNLQLSSEQIDLMTFRASSTSNRAINVTPPFNSQYIGLNNIPNSIIYFQNDSTFPNRDNGNVFFPNTTFTANQYGLYEFTFTFSCKVKHIIQTGSPVNFRLPRQIGNILIYGKSRGGNATIASVPVVLLPNGFDYVSGALNIVAKNGTNIISNNDESEVVTGTLTGQVTMFPNDNALVLFNPSTSDVYQLNFPSNAFYSNISNYPQITFLSGSVFTNKVVNNLLIEQATINMSTILPDKIRQSDFFNSIIKMFNLFIEVDKSNPNKLIIEPRTTFYNTGVIKDWSDKLDYSKETKIIPMGEINVKKYIYTYKTDSDYFNNDYQTTYQDAYGTKTYEIQNDFLKGENKNEVIFSATPLVNTIGHDRVIPKIYQVDTNGTIKPCQSNIRILYYGGLKNTSYGWKITSSDPNAGISTKIYIQYPYAGHLDDWQNPKFDLSFDVPRQVYYTPTRYTNNNLFNKYHRDYVEQIANKDSKIFVGYFLIDEFDIQDLDFKNKFYFENEYWILNKIIDYDRVMNKPTKCEFIKL